MSSTRPVKCLICECPHDDEMDFIRCEAGEFFEILLEQGTLTQESLDSIRRKYEGV